MPFLFAIPLAYFYIRLVYTYYAYYDIGINNSANSFYLVFIVMPIMFVLFNITGFTAEWLAKRRGMNNKQKLGIGILAMITLFLLAFLYTYVRHLGYPSLKSYNLLEFLGYLFGVQ